MKSRKLAMRTILGPSLAQATPGRPRPGPKRAASGALAVALAAAAAGGLPKQSAPRSKARERRETVWMPSVSSASVETIYLEREPAGYTRRSRFVFSSTWTSSATIVAFLEIASSLAYSSLKNVFCVDGQAPAACSCIFEWRCHAISIGNVDATGQWGERGGDNGKYDRLVCNTYEDR